MDNAFVRNDMIPPAPPPGGQQGVIKWMRENLFSGWLNSILTLLAIWVVYSLVVAALPWLLHSVWNAKSLGECRDIITATWGDGASGACWAVIHERWHQFMFGFYPMDLYWRPIMVFFLLFVAMAPVLFYDGIATQRRVILVSLGLMLVVQMLIAFFHPAAWPVPEGGWPTAGPIVYSLVVAAILIGLAFFAPDKLIWFIGLFPAIAFWMLWGGSIWGPVMAVVGFGLLALVFRLLAPRLGTATSAGIAFVVAVAWWLHFQTYVSTAFESLLPIDLAPVVSDRFGGFLLAFVIGVTAIIASLPLGILLALGRRSDMPLIKYLSIGDIEFIRGVPLITMLFTASLLLQYFLPPQVKFDLVLRVIILVTLFAAAYIAEVVRGGLAALPRGQYEAADALGLDYWQAQRLIIMPQALKISIPGIVSSFIGLFKDTTLVAFVGLADPLSGVVKIVRADINWKGVYWEPYIFVGAIFFIFCFSMSRYSMFLERKLKRDHR